MHTYTTDISVMVSAEVRVEYSTPVRILIPDTYTGIGASLIFTTVL